jgi:hypothetical protein
MIEGVEIIEVESVSFEKDYQLLIRFNNGQTKNVDLSSLLNNPPPVFVKLRDTNEFKKVSVNPVGGIQWDCGADLSADFLLSA